jgi:Fur family ferric uptake transcriptional regulator
MGEENDTTPGETTPVETLRKAGLRATLQRQAILAVMERASDHPTAEDILERARTLDPSVAISTVYRTLGALEGAGLVQKLAFDDAPARYELATERDHEHLVDLDTGEVIEIVSEEAREMHQKTVGEMGYEVVSYRTVLYVRKRS